MCVCMHTYTQDDGGDDDGGIDDDNDDDDNDDDDEDYDNYDDDNEKVQTYFFHSVNFPSLDEVSFGVSVIRI